MNKTNDSILEFLDYFCRHDGALHYATLIKGKWGSGKTFLIRRFFEMRSDISIIYVSLYGMKEVADIEDAFFAQLHPVLSHKGMRVAGAVLKGLIRGGLKIDLDKIDGVGASVDGSGVDVGLPKFLSKASGRVLVFDDLERAEMPLKKLMGYINTFVEHDDNKVILIANEDEIALTEREGYLKTKEKLIGKTFELEVDFAAALDEFIDTVKDTDAKAFFATSRQRLETIFRQSGTNNLRIVQQGMWDFERLLLKLVPDQRKNAAALDAIFAPFVALLFELRAGRLEPENLNGLDQTDWSRYFKKDKGEKSWREVLESRYPEVRFDESIVGADVLEGFLFRSALDVDVISARMAASRFFTKPSDMPSWRRLWDHSSISDKDAEEAAKDVEEQFAKRAYEDPGVLLQVFGLRLWLADISGKSKADVAAECETYVDDLGKAGRLPLADPRGPRFDDLGRSCNGLGYHEYEAPEFKRVARYLSDSRQRALEASYPDEARALLAEMVKDPNIFFHRLNASHAGDGKYSAVPILTYVDVRIFAGALLSMSKDGMRTAVLTFKPRYEFLRSYPALVPEIAWCRQLEAILLAEAGKRGPIGKHDLQAMVGHYLSEPLQEVEREDAALLAGDSE